MTGWTTPANVLQRLRSRWESGEFLQAWANGQAWEPVDIRLSSPTARDLANDLAAARAWAEQWKRARGYRLVRKKVGGRLIGVNDVPARAIVDEPDQLWSILQVETDVRVYARLLDSTRTHGPRLVDWVLSHPMRVLAYREIWLTVLDTLNWIGQHTGRSVYLRQIDVPGVDTKFVERHRGLLGELLDRYLDAERIDETRSRKDFAHRYGFLGKPSQARIRTLDPSRPLAGGFTELVTRADELSTRPPACERVYIIENEITYLAFPAVPRAVVVYGSGYAVGRLRALDWLADRDLVYWGDIDTHGFAILNRLRHQYPRVRSLLMDRATLMAHHTQWIEEPSPTSAQLDRLDPAEADLYRDLVEDTFGSRVRLEQERINYAVIERAVNA